MAQLADSGQESQPLAGQVAIVTGAGRGLGKAYAIALAKAGAAVAVTARTESEIQAVQREIEQSSGRGLAIPADVTDPKAVTDLVASVEQQLGAVDLLVNNAGLLRAIGTVAEIEEDLWWREMEVNLRGPFLMTRAVLPSMIARRRGRIINLASGAGLNPVSHGTAYCVSKTALIRFSEALDLETRPEGIKVFAISPGTAKTPMNDYLLTSPEVRQRAPHVTKMFERVYGEGLDTPIEQSVELVLWLASGKGDSLSGRYVDCKGDLNEFVRQVEETQQKDLYTLRLQRPAEILT